ncbi:hypothetical protein [uncultured Hymenobacter sp.]|uniref:hypothetical protein n=1 Tax=uncultured Hymenobacter sp. TaxID=170016 RepID=UPI0035C98722
MKSPVHLGAHGRLALLKDAAHVVSSITGSGYRHALLDAQALVDALTATSSPVVSRLLACELARLGPAAGAHQPEPWCRLPAVRG